MKKKIHPEYKKTIVTCGCGNTFETGSTREKIGVEVCSACHPFFTGKERLVDTAGRVERFQRKWTSGEAQKKVQEHAERRARRELAVERARKKAEAVAKGEARIEDLSKMGLGKAPAPVASPVAPAQPAPSAEPKPGTK